MKSLTLLGALALASAAHAQSSRPAAPSTAHPATARAIPATTELGKASAIAGLTLLLGGVAVLKGRGRTLSSVPHDCRACLIRLASKCDCSSDPRDGCRRRRGGHR